VFVDELFNGKENGYFVEVGALDGIMNSTTYFFEKHKNWDGIVVEPNPGWYITCTSDTDCQKDHLFDHFTQTCRAGSPLVSIRTNRKTVSRKAISDVNGTLKFICTSNPAFSGIKNESKQDTENLKLEKEIEVQTCTLTELLDEFNAPKTIDYISLDVEGAELKILRKFFADNKYTVKVISLENDKLMYSAELMIHQQNFIKLDNHYLENLRVNNKIGKLKLVGQYPDILLDEDFVRIDWEHIYVNRKYMKLF
jgi:FkbM family methyltransferase